MNNNHEREAFSDTELNKLSDTELIDQLCKARAVFQYTMDGESYFAVECLTPLSRVWNTPRGQEAKSCTTSIRNIELE